MERKKEVTVKAFLSPRFAATNTPKPSVEAPSQPAATPASQTADPFGMDDIMSMMGKFQKFYGMFQSIQPAFKMISSFLGPTAAIKGMKSSAAKNKGRKTSKSKHPSTISKTSSHRKTNVTSLPRKKR